MSRAIGTISVVTRWVIFTQNAANTNSTKHTAMSAGRTSRSSLRTRMKVMLKSRIHSISSAVELLVNRGQSLRFDHQVRDWLLRQPVEQHRQRAAKDHL